MGEPGTAKRGRTRIARLGLCSVILAMLAQGCGASTRRDVIAEAKPSVPLYSERAATAVADALLAAVPLPAETQHVSGPPRAVAAELGRPINIDEANDVDRYAYWSSTDPPEALLSFLAKNGPFSKVQYSGSGGTAGKTDSWSETLEVPLRSPLAGPRQLFVSIALDGSGRYAVRVDAVVAWHKRRPASSLVPATARLLEVTITTPAYRALNPGEPSHAHVTTRSVITTDPSTVRAVARAVNEMPVAEPGGGPPPGCPAMGVANTEGAPRFVLSFRSTAASSDLAEVRGRSGFVCASSGDAVAKITTPEDQQGVLLTDHLILVEVVNEEGLSEHLELAFHHSLHLVPEE
jgi:hypothetical protein